MNKMLAGFMDRLTGTREARYKTAAGIATCIGGLATLFGTDIDPAVIAGITTTIATVLGLFSK